MTDARADAIVSCGNSAQILELPPMDTIIGDLDSVIRDAYPGTWAQHDEYGPSLRPDGSIIMDSSCYVGDCGPQGWSTRTCKDF